MPILSLCKSIQSVLLSQKAGDREEWYDDFFKQVNETGYTIKKVTYEEEKISDEELLNNESESDDSMGISI